VTVDQFAAHAYLDNISDSDSELIAAYIAAAEDAVSREVKRPLGVCDVVFFWPGADASSLQISYTPLVDVKRVTVDGEDVQFAVNDCGVYPRIALACNAIAQDAEIAAYCTVGYDPVPQALRVAVMMLVAGMFEHRTDQVEQSLTNTAAFERLLAAYRQEFVY
jgi:hypothetical protein